MLKGYGSNFDVSNTVIYGNGNFITGSKNEIRGNGNKIHGNENTIFGNGNNVAGNKNDVKGNGNLVDGNNNKLHGISNKHRGINNISTKPKCVQKILFNGAKFGGHCQFGSGSTMTIRNGKVVGKKTNGMFGNLTIKGGNNQIGNENTMTITNYDDGNETVQVFKGLNFDNNSTVQFGPNSVMTINNESDSDEDEDESDSDEESVLNDIFEKQSQISDDINNVTMRQNGDLVVAENGVTSYVSINNEIVKFRIYEGKFLTIDTNYGVFRTDLETNVLVNANRKKNVSNFYISREDDNEIMYECFDSNFKMFLYKDKAILRNYKNMPKLELSFDNNKRKKSPTKDNREKKKRKTTKPVKIDENNKISTDCKVCFENVIDTVILDCKHSCLCSDCAKKLKTCPICREEIRKILNVIIS